MFKVFYEGRIGGGGGGLWHGSPTEILEDNGYKNFVFPNHENKQARCSF